MNKKYDRPLYIIAAVCALFAIVFDGFMSGHGLGTMIGCLIMIAALVVCAGMLALDNSRARATQKRDAELRASMIRQTPQTPIFAHVPGPGEPGYDPTYDPDDDKYWRRCYRDDD